MISYRRQVVWCILMFFPVCFSLLAYGDGKAFPLPTVAAPPTIPQQRAMIVWKDGMETLAVESTFETESKEVGWVLPLPAKPAKLETASPGMLQSMSFSLRSRIINEIWDGKSFLVPLLIICSVVSLCSLISPRITALNMFLLIIMCVFIYSVFTVSLHMGRSGGMGVECTDDVTVLSSEQVGNYTTSVIQTKTPEALSDWLKDNGFKTLEESDKVVVRDYITRQWVFVVAKLRKENDQPLTPHPILATFPAKAPIYPMKLTALAGGGKTRVELFVVADEQAKAKEFQTIAADTFTPVAPNRKGYRNYMEAVPQAYYKSGQTDLIIGNPDAQKLLWPGCVVTRLIADLSPDDMSRDVECTMKSCSPYREQFYSEVAKSKLIENIGLLGAVIVVVMLGLIFRRGREPGNRSRELMFPLGALIGVFVVTGVLWAAFPARKALVGIQYSSQGLYSNFGWQVWEIQQAVDEGKIDETMNDEELKAAVTKAIKSEIEDLFDNPYTQETMIWQRSPGNLWIHRQDGKVYLCFYNYDGQEFRVDLRKMKQQRTEY